jgi:hypothetical protein
MAITAAQEKMHALLVSGRVQERPRRPRAGAAPSATPPLRRSSPTRRTRERESALWIEERNERVKVRRKKKKRKRKKEKIIKIGGERK